MPIKVYSPLGSVVAGHLRPAARPSSLAGARIAVLDNAKAKAGFLLGTLADRIAESTGAVRTVTVKKPSPAVPASDQLVTRIREEADLALIGTAD